jgi:predicted MFS family arabinose efflux permease
MAKAPNAAQRWGVLACFAAAAGLSQFLWLNFAPIVSQIQSRYGIGESQASLLLLVFPLIYVFLSIHAGSLTDRKGYRLSLVLGTGLMAVFSCLRIYLGSFWFLLFAQVGIAVAQPYVVNAVSKLVLDWFEKEHEALATGLGTMGMFIGMAAGLAATPPLVEAIGMEKTMAVFAAVSCATFAACWIWVVPNPRQGKHGAMSAGNLKGDLAILLRDRDLLLVFLLAFLGLGYFNGLTTWLEPILAPNGMGSVQAGLVGGALIVGGIAGSALIPALSDRLKRRRPFLIACIAAGCALVYPLTATTHFKFALLLAAAQGFVFLPAFALLLEAASELAGPTLAGSATGLLMLCGNAGAVIVIVAMEAIKGDSPTFERAIVFLIVLLIVAVLSATRLKETYRLKGLGTV